MMTLNQPNTAPARTRDSVGIVLGVSTIATGLIAGLYYSFSVAVTLGLANADDLTFVTATQKTNESIQNPLFFFSFLGALAFPVVALVMLRRRGLKEVVRWTFAAAVLYAFTLVTTTGINIPLNNELAAAGDPAHIANLAAVRDHYETTWNIWNGVRTVAATAALGCLGRAMILYGRADRLIGRDRS